MEIEEGKLKLIKQGYNEKNKLLQTIEQWVNEFDKYFSRCPFYLNIEGSFEDTQDIMSLEQTQTKGENLYFYERELNAISVDIEKTTRDLENLQREQFRHSELLAKVLEAQKVVNRMPEKDRLVESITEHRKQSNDCKIDIGILERKFSDLKDEQEKCQKLLDQYKRYFEKHQEIDFDFLNAYKRALISLNIEREKHRKLLTNFHDLATKQEEYRLQMEQIQRELIPVEKTLNEIVGVIQGLEDEKNILSGKLGDLEKDVTPTIEEGYDYRRLIEDNFSHITLGDCLSLFRLMYNGKFSEAILEGYMPDFDQFVKSLYIESTEITEDRKYSQGRLVINLLLKQIRTLTQRIIKESAIKDY